MMDRYFGIIGISCILLQGCTTPMGMLERNLVIQEQQAMELTTQRPLVNSQLGSVTFNVNKICLNCGDFQADLTYEFADQRFKQDFPSLLEKQLRDSGIFPASAFQHLNVRATLTDLKQKSTVGAAAEKMNPATSGSILAAHMTVRYELVDGNRVVGTWNISSGATSNSLSSVSRRADALDNLLTRNVRAFILRVVADLSPMEADRANRALAAMEVESNDTRTIMGTIVYRASKTVSATAGVVNDGLSLVAQNSGAIAAGLSTTAVSMDAKTREINNSYSQALFASRQQAVNNSSSRSPSNEKTDNASSSLDKQKSTSSKTPSTPVVANQSGQSRANNQSTLVLTSVSGAVNTATQNEKANKEKSPTYADPNPYDMKSEWGMHPRYGSKVDDMWKTRAEACSAAQKEAASASKVNIVVEALSPCVCVRNLLKELNPYGPDSWQCSIYAKVKWVGGSNSTTSK